MIGIRLQGGLGNQMFQYACGLSLSESLQKKLVLDLSYFEGQTDRNFALGEWKIPENLKVVSTQLNALPLAYSDRPSMALRHPKSLLKTLYCRLLRLKYQDWQVIFEREAGHFQNLSQLINPEKKAFLSGYWQSEKYFMAIEKRILEIFTPSQNLCHEDQMLSSKMLKNSVSVSVHIRCGDYLNDFNTWKTHFVSTPAYYQDAFHLMKEKLAPLNPHFYIFSDDPAWVKANIGIPHPHTFVSNGERNDAHEISLMSKCHHQIISNSSFSWWGAWLNRKKKKIVITPPRWFNNSNLTPDIIPQEWTQCYENTDGVRDYIDLPYAEKRFFTTFGKLPDLEKPQSFNEKIQWIKLYNREPIHTILCDKLAVRDYVADKIGGKYLNKLIDVYDSADKINFSKLPESYVLKANHGSGWNILCPHKSKLNKKKARKKLNEWLDDNYYYHGREWCYKNIVPRIICEAFIHNTEGRDLLDYKVFCFNGTPRYIQVDVDRHTNHTRVFYNLQWQKQPFTTFYPLYINDIARPEKLDELLDLAKVLSKGLNFARIDFYYVHGKYIFGEITLYHGNGFEPFYPTEYDKKLGEELCLPRNHTLK